MSQWNERADPISLPGCGGLTLAGSKRPTQLFPHSPPQQDRGEEKMKVLMGQGKDRDIIYHGQDRLDFRKINLI